MSKKTFLLDTNVLMRSPHSLFVFEENDVCICHTTLEELDTCKAKPGEAGYNAREAIRTIRSLHNGGNLAEGIALPSTGTFRVVPDCESADLLPVGWSYTKSDNRVIATAKAIKATLVTSDIAMLLKAEAAGVKVETYRNEQVSDETLKYTGRQKVYATSEAINAFYQYGQISTTDLYTDDTQPQLHINEFLVIADITNSKNTALGYYDGRMIQKLKHAERKPYGIIPKNAGQRFALEALLAPANEIPLVILKGPAGVAKTFLALAAGLETTIKKDQYRKLLMFRPNVKFDEDIGYIKGDEFDKIKPLIRPYMDNLEVLLSEKGETPGSISRRIDDLFYNGVLAAEAMAYLRGRSITNTYIICDEAQNSSPNQMKGVLTRAGLNSKLVILGDPDQIDNPKLDKKNNGLVYASEKMLGSALCMQLTFSSDECVRSPLAQEASELL